MLVAYLNLDEVIRIIRREEEPKPVLMKRFELTEIQAEAILETKLRHLAKLEEMKIRGEQKELAEERDELDKILKSKARLQEAGARRADSPMPQTFGDERRSKIVERAAAQAIDETELVTSRADDGRAVRARLGARGEGSRTRSHARCRTRPAMHSSRPRAAAARSRPCSSTAPVARTACSRTRCRRREGRANRCRAASIRRKARRSPVC